jgi:hypothetical protein
MGAEMFLEIIDLLDAPDLLALGKKYANEAEGSQR